MSYEFKKLSEVEALTEVPDSATVLAEVGGAIKRIPGSGLGGGKVLKIIYSNFGEYLNSSTPMASAGYTFEANMTLDEARAVFRACELDGAHVYMANVRLTLNYIVELDNGGDAYFMFMGMNENDRVYIWWTEEYGITGYNPYSDN